MSTGTVGTAKRDIPSMPKDAYAMMRTPSGRQYALCHDGVVLAYNSETLGWDRCEEVEQFLKVLA